jgi:SWI/SNF related-matrix-associated actin-dependent regulator of chromatin subfamily C
MISEHVGSRSKEQCITQFLQLPINDEFLTAQLTKTELEELPFGELPNPVMTTIAFLAGHVNPGVGAAAAKTALKSLLKSSKDQGQEREESSVKIEKAPEKVDSMDIGEGEDESHQVVEPDVGAFSKQAMKEATVNALKSAVEVARKLASYENQEIQHWTRLAVKTMVDKLTIKLQQFDELEVTIDTELQELIKQQSALAESIESLSTQRFPATEGEIL